MKSLEGKERLVERAREIPWCALEILRCGDQRRVRKPDRTARSVRSNRPKQMLKRPEVTLPEILELPSLSVDERAIFLRQHPQVTGTGGNRAEVRGVLKRQQEQIEAFERSEHISIPEGFDFRRVRSLSKEGKEKLEACAPTIDGQASRISGVTAGRPLRPSRRLEAVNVSRGTLSPAVSPTTIQAVARANGLAVTGGTGCPTGTVRRPAPGLEREDQPDLPA